jgi:hypothetical protein
MIAVQLYPREKVQQILKGDYGCEFVEPVDSRNDGYKTPWGHHFVVPAIGEDGMCPRVALHEVIASFERTRPTTQN